MDGVQQTLLKYAALKVCVCMIDSIVVFDDIVFSVVSYFVNFLLQMLPRAHVPLAMSLQQLSPVLCH